jgi:GDP-L-fucose synthase
LKTKVPLTIWGTGKPLREFMYVEDLANAIVFMMENIDAKDLYENGITHLNVGSGKDITIADLAKLISEITVGLMVRLNMIHQNQMEHQENLWM